MTRCRLPPEPAFTVSELSMRRAQSNWTATASVQKEGSGTRTRYYRNWLKFVEMEELISCSALPKPTSMFRVLILSSALQTQGRGRRSFLFTGCEIRRRGGLWGREYTRRLLTNWATL